MNRLPAKKEEFVPPRRQHCPKQTFLRVGDKVVHEKYKFWGGGIVTETWNSDLPGGSCFVRILFQDGKQRVFDNNFESACCCYYAGITLLNRIPL